MIKGCQKKIIVVQGGESSPFESAFFLMRRDVSDGGSGDVLREADRIISEGLPRLEVCRRRRERLSKIFLSAGSFFLGLLLGAGICAIFALFSR
ncbi:MAG: hypothetical protein IKB47_01300 [Clostridia bacterium]|nr:hypothetical protein [Clostridia bacterium]